LERFGTFPLVWFRASAMEDATVGSKDTPDETGRVAHFQPQLLQHFVLTQVVQQRFRTGQAVEKFRQFVLFKVRVTPNCSKQLVAPFGFDLGSRVNVTVKSYLSELGIQFL
jgi:hypothetical protein